MGDETLGRYTVLKHLATGGMADVLLGRTDGIEGFERHVVLKRIRAEHANDKRFIQMFLNEARVAANLHHQNIVQVFDIGEANGQHFFAMEYIHGEDLRRLLSAASKKRMHVPLGHVVAILSAAAAGLHYAHERKGHDKKPLGLVHRDVSPSNILISYDGAVKVVDFGIAKAATHQHETRAGTIKGKVSYMSPEQCKGDPVDRRSDIYALGVLLYELSTTSRLFKGDNDYLLMDAIVNGKVPLPRVKRPDLPNELSQIIMTALAVDPDRRYQTAEDLRTALDQFAIKAGLTVSTAALAGFMNKMFGEKPEPWLDLPATAKRPATSTDTGLTPNNSWAEIPAADAFDEPEVAQAEEPRHRSAIGRAVSASESRSSMKMGWEREPSAPVLPPARRGKAGLFIIPALAIVGVAVWHFALKPAPEKAADTQVAATPAAPAGSVLPQPPAPAVAPPQEIPPVRVTGPEGSAQVAAVEPTPAPVEPAPEPAAAVDKAPKVKRTFTTKKGPEKVAATTSTPEPTPAPGSAAPGSAAAPAPTPEPTPPPAPTPAPPPPPPPPVEPKMVEAAVAILSPATVAGIASDHSRQLAKCEVGATLRGDVAVTFQIDGTGKVVKSQLASSIKNPKVAACILKAVQTWKFPKPPSGAAKGVYSISYQ